MSTLIIIGIFYHLIVVFLVYFLLFKKKLTKGNQLIILLVLGLIALYIKCYVLWAYLFVGAIFWYIGLEKLKFNKKKLELENYKINSEVLPSIFVLKYCHVIFIILTLTIVFFFNVFIGAFYFIFIILGIVSGFFKLNIYKAIPKELYLYLKDCRKDLNTIKYHWGTHFFSFKIFNRLTLISIPLEVFVLIIALPFHPANDPILFLNLYEIGIISCITFIGSFIIDLYIISFGNS